MRVYVLPVNQILLYPSSWRPLSLSEPRHKRMIEDAMATNTPIVLAPIEDDIKQHNLNYGESLNFVRQVVGFGRPQILEQRMDGSWLISIQGMGKVKLGNAIQTDKPYIVCEAEIINENLVLQEDRVQEFIRVQRILLNWMNTNIPDPQAREQLFSQLKTADEVIGCYANYVLNDQDCQQVLLEENDINTKVNILNRLICSGELL
jgi:uncharacterized protein